MKYNKLINKLEQYYPDKNVKSLSTKHRELYNSINGIARRQGTSIGTIIKSWGFEYHFGGILFDPAIALRLHNDYKMPFQRFAEWTGYTKQMISCLIIKYQNGTPIRCSKLGNWSGNHLSADETNTLIEMIKSGEFTRRAGESKLILGNNGSGKVYLAVINSESIAVHFENTIPINLLNQIRNSRMDVLSEKELRIIKSGSISKISTHFIPYPSTRQMFYAAAHKRGMSFNEFSIFLTGLPYTTMNTKVIDKKIVQFLKANQVDGEVFISSHPSNQWIHYIASCRSISLCELVLQYGFKLASKSFSRRNSVFSR